jgi:hypothetical protein
LKIIRGLLQEAKVVQPAVNVVHRDHPDGQQEWHADRRKY